MADASRRTAAPEQGSYKTKLLQPSETNDLFAPDQAATKVKLPPSEGAKAPPTTLGGAGPNKSWAPGGSTQSAVDARHKFSGDAQGCEADDDYQLPQGSTVVAQPTHVDDRDVGGDDDDVAAAAGPNKSWAPGGSTQSAVDARHKFSGDRQGSEADDDYQLPQGSTVVAQPTHVDDRDVGADSAAAAAGPNKSWAPGGSTQSAVDACHRFSGDRQGSEANDDYQLPEGSTVVAQPQHVDEPRVDDSSAGLSVKTGQTADKQEQGVTSPDSKSQNPLAAAAATVASTAAAAAKPVAAVVGQLKSVVVGSGGEKSEGDEEEQEEVSEGLRIAMSEYVEIEGGDKVLAAAVL